MLIALISASFLIAFLIAFYLTPSIAACAKEKNIVDNPDNNLKNHKTPTPYLGGVVVFIAFVCSIFLTLPIDNNASLVVMGGSLLLLLGLLDDLIPLKPIYKFIGQMIVAAYFVKAGICLKEHFFYSYRLILSFVWMLTIINAFNLIDVMDGLATLVALSAGVTFFCIAFLAGQFLICMLLAAFCGALVGFLYYNWPTAEIYLGDAGALFIGGFLAAVPLLINWGTYTPFGLIVPVMVLFFPLSEISMLILIRTYQGIPFFKGSSHHFVHFLKNKHFSVPGILILVLNYSIIIGLLSYFIFGAYIGPISGLLSLALLSIIWVFITYS